MDRRQYLSRAGIAVAVSVSLAGCSSDSGEPAGDETPETSDSGENVNDSDTGGGANDSVGTETTEEAVGGGKGGGTETSDDGGESEDAFGIVASDTSSSKVPLDGSVDKNVLTGFEVVDHVGILSGAGPVKISARVRNVGSKTVRLVQRHTERAVLYGPDGQELEVIRTTNTEGSGVDGVPPGETVILNFFGPNGYSSADIGRYGIVLDCSGETTIEANRSPYCPPPE